MCKQRNTYIDIAKGIGIIMVLGLHTGFHFEWMTPFEMPLFFFLSGVLFNEKIPFKLFVVKKTNTLLLPFIFFEMPAWIYNISYALFHPGVSVSESMMNSAIPTAGWFLLCL